MVPWRSPKTGETVTIGRGIITPAEQSHIVDIIEDRAIVRKSRRDRCAPITNPYLMTGWLRCGACQGRMSAGGRSYVCQARRTGHFCPAHTTAYIAAVDRSVVAAWDSKLAAAVPGDPTHQAVVERWVGRHHPDLIRERTTIRNALNDAEAALVDVEAARFLRNEFQGASAIGRWHGLHERLSDRVAGLRRNLADFPLPEVDINPLRTRNAWQGANIEERRTLLSLAISSVTVLPANGRRGYRFDPVSRLRFAWADEREPTSIAPAMGREPMTRGSEGLAG